ncbi:hypothetical protein ACP8HI_19985 [Paenibacillus sp. FA6]
MAQSKMFLQGVVITWGIGHLAELKEPKAYDPPMESMDTWQLTDFAGML